MEVLAVILDSFTRTILRIYDNSQILFIRWLLVRDEEDQQEKSVIDIEHIQSGDGQRVSNLEEASLWMQEIDADAGEKERETEK